LRTDWHIAHTRGQKFIAAPRKRKRKCDENIWRQKTRERVCVCLCDRGMFEHLKRCVFWETERDRENKMCKRDHVCVYLCERGTSGKREREIEREKVCVWCDRDGGRKQYGIFEPIFKILSISWFAGKTWKKLKQIFHHRCNSSNYCSKLLFCNDWTINLTRGGSKHSSWLIINRFWKRFECWPVANISPLWEKRGKEGETKFGDFDICTKPKKCLALSLSLV